MDACDKDFLERYPLDAPSTETFWNSASNAQMWVNQLYTGLPNGESVLREYWSDNAFARLTSASGDIANGTLQTNSNNVLAEWNYSKIRECLEFFENVELIPTITQEKKNELTGQVRFILAFKYFELITLFRDVPLLTKPLTVTTSDIPKSPKSEILSYILEHLDKAIVELPLTWPISESGRITKGAALALKARVLLYNERWAEAASTAKQLMDLNLYSLHPKFDELFLKKLNNKTKEVILAYQYAETVNQHDIYRKMGFVADAGFAYILPLPDLGNSFECIDGLPIEESPLYNPNDPFKNRDPRFYATFIYPYQTFAGYYYDPFAGVNPGNSLTYLHYRKYCNDKEPGAVVFSYVNWIIFRYAEILLIYAEAKNEATGPDNSIYEMLDLIRLRAGMPVVNRTKYNTKELLRNLIRNERRIEFAAEGLRYFDIIRWRIAEKVLNKEVTSFEIPGILPLRVIEKRVFDPNKNYVWPIPQSAIDKAKNLEQNPEWK